jgi:uncharacterized protein (DUF1778 family)
MKKRQVSLRLTPREHRVLLFAAMLAEQSPSDFVGSLLRSLPLYAKTVQAELNPADDEPSPGGRRLELVT